MLVFVVLKVSLGLINTVSGFLDALCVKQGQLSIDRFAFEFSFSSMSPGGKLKGWWVKGNQCLMREMASGFFLYPLCNSACPLQREDQAVELWASVCGALAAAGPGLCTTPAFFS